MKWTTCYLPATMFLYFIGGCAGGCAKGDAGPMGPSGSNGINGQNGYPASSTFLYNNNFDTASNVNEWIPYVNVSGTVTASLTSTSFVSVPESLDINLSATNGSNVALAINYLGSGNIIFDSYQNFDGFPFPSDQAEYVFFFNGKRHMTIGVLQTSSSNTNLYSYNGANRITLYGSLDVGVWHHLTSVWHQSSDSADYYIDGNLLGQNFLSSALTWNTPVAGPYEIAFYLPAGSGGGGDWHVDNFSIGQ
jgi:hypothetical protein